MLDGRTADEIGKLEEEDLDGIGNKIWSDLKSNFDRAMADCDYNKKVVLSAMIENGLSFDEEGRVVVDEENLRELLKEYGDIY